MAKESTVTIPDEIEFDESDMKEMGKQRTLAPTGKKGRIRFRCIDTTKSVSEEKGTMQLVLKAAPLKDPDDADSAVVGLSVRHGLTLPLRNKDFPGHRPPNTAGLCINYYHAVLEEDDESRPPSYPRYDKENRVYMYNGEEIEKDDQDSCKAEANKLLAAKLKEDWAEPANRLDDAFYAEVVVNAQGFVNLKNETRELPEDCELVPFERWQAEVVEEEEQEEKPAPKAATSKKPAAKKAATKGKKK